MDGFRPAQTPHPEPQPAITPTESGAIKQQRQNPESASASVSVEKSNPSEPKSTFDPSKKSQRKPRVRRWMLIVLFVIVILMGAAYYWFIVRSDSGSADQQSSMSQDEQAAQAASYVFSKSETQKHPKYGVFFLEQDYGDETEENPAVLKIWIQRSGVEPTVIAEVNNFVNTGTPVLVNERDEVYVHSRTSIIRINLNDGSVDEAYADDERTISGIALTYDKKQLAIATLPADDASAESSVSAIYGYNFESATTTKLFATTEEGPGYSLIAQNKEGIWFTGIKAPKDGFFVGNLDPETGELQNDIGTLYFALSRHGNFYALGQDEITAPCSLAGAAASYAIVDAFSAESVWQTEKMDKHLQIVDISKDGSRVIIMARDLIKEPSAIESADCTTYWSQSDDWEYFVATKGEDEVKQFANRAEAYAEINPTEPYLFSEVINDVCTVRLVDGTWTKPCSDDESIEFSNMTLFIDQ